MMRGLDRKRWLVSIAVVAVFLTSIAIAIRALSSRAEVVRVLRDQRQEMVLLKDEVLSLRRKIEPAERRKSLSNVQGVLQAVEEVFSPIGLKDRVKTVKVIYRKETKEGVEEAADLVVERLTMNEMVNVFYRIEHVPFLLAIKKATIKQSFENPELLNLSLTLSFSRMTEPTASSSRSPLNARDLT